MASNENTVRAGEPFTPEQTERFMASLRAKIIEYKKAHGLPVPDFSQLEHYELPRDYYPWKDGIPRIPTGSDRLTWRSKEGNIVIVTRDGYAYDDNPVATSRLQEVIERLAEYEDGLR